MTVTTTDPDTVYSRCFGHGARRVLALHCTIAHSGAWRGVTKLMEKEATFVAPDMFSHGRSPDWDGKGDFPDLMNQAVARLLDSPMDVVGHSFGALIGLRLAVEHPHLVRTLTLIEPVFFAVAAQDAPDLVARQSQGVRPVFEALEAGDSALAARLFNRAWGDGGTRWPDLREETRAAMTRGIHILPASNSAIYDDRPGLLRPGVLQALKMPVLLIRGSRTEEIITAVNDGLARRIPHAQSDVVQGAGHMLPITHPDETAAHLRRHFAQVTE
ncbi:alpha/beta fold hydrolase [Sedimentitalea todarodis]|uniref:Alpha/beta hydrolase n=1 Tax=Sedimentitalea todarodis TaxID=1631240 RepID=A0ABU3V822_9RHOB|nr:alpha/beta hydrolase [Sedimentitalea todarodis]MDU9002326.1 alpha/beta hydrolase [Sedimentitalea todarodis]